MRRSYLFVPLALLVGLTAGIGWGYAQQRSEPALTAQDLADITQLHSRYNQGTDFMDAAMWLGVFSDDAVFKPGAGPSFVGKKALTEWRAKNFAARQPGRGGRHWNSSFVVTPTPGGAKGRLYWLGVSVGDKTVVGGSGYYDDVYVKTSNGWRIKEREAVSDSAPKATQ